MKKTLPDDDAFASEGENGMSKRELIASMALQGLLANSATPLEECAEEAVIQADRLIAKLNK